MDWGRQAQERLTEIAACSETTEGVTRFPFTPEHRKALAHIDSWMTLAGLTPRLDAAGTLVGAPSIQVDGPRILIGSHQDSVRNGGRYDGIMGVLIGCLALEKLRSENTAPPLPVEVLAFADEEGVRFPTALMGPRALAGTFPQEALDGADAQGVELRDALTGFGGAPDQLQKLARRPDRVDHYLEIHIEQGPVLEQADLPLAVVTGICGIERLQVTLTGETGHAGTLPMPLRRDALVGASEFIQFVSEAASKTTNVRATIGALTVAPNVVNAVPKSVSLTLEIRSVDDTARAAFRTVTQAQLDAIAARKQLHAQAKLTYEQRAEACDARLRTRLSAAVEQVQGRAFELPSGATHDASAMADLCPIAMLFVRCRGGVSHRPDEYVTEADLGAAVEATARYLAQLPSG